MKLPFLRPQIVLAESYRCYLDEMDSRRWYTNFGPLNQRFESLVKDRGYGGQGEVVTVSNCTLGLMLAIAASKKPGKYALMPSYTFSATPLAAMWCGLTPFFVDIDPITLCLCQTSLEQAISLIGDDVAAIVPCATFGLPLDYEIYAKYHTEGIPVIIDAAPAFGLTTNCYLPGMGFPGSVVFSLHATKPFGIGEGGLVYSANADLIERIRRLSNFGFDNTRVSVEMGMNAKLSEICAAIALAEADAFPNKLAKRLTVFAYYKQGLDHSRLNMQGWQLPENLEDTTLQFVTIITPSGEREAALSRLLQAGVESRTYFSPPCHFHPIFSHCPKVSLSHTEEIASRCLSLPLWEDMSLDQVSYVLAALDK